MVIRARGNTASALLLLGMFAVALSAPELTDVRRTFHDAVGLFYGRILMTDAVRNGSLPLWYTYARYSIPFYSLEGGMGWSPIGFLVGAFAPYDLFSWAIEGLLWNLICLGGTFLFARHHVSSAYTAAAIAMTYAASGLMMATVPTIGTTRAFQVGPWAFYAIDTLARPEAWDRTAWARGTATLAAAGMLWLSSGYPGIWLTAPVLVAPYALMATRGRTVPSLALASGAAVAAVLALGMCSLLTDGTLSTPYFGQVGKRSPYSPADGALQYRTLLHAFLANPGYLRDASGPLEPLYMGAALLPGLLMIRPVFPRPIIGLLLPVISVGVAFGQLVTGHAQPWLLVLHGLTCAAAVSQRRFAITYQDALMLAPTALSIALASGNPIGDFFRTHVPPFTMVRWNDWYLWVAVLCLATHAWQNIEHRLALADWGVPFSFRIASITWREAPTAIMIFISISSILLGIHGLPAPFPVDYDVIHAMTHDYLFIFVILLLIIALISFLYYIVAKGSWFNKRLLWALAFLAAPIASGMIAGARYPGGDEAHRIGLPVSSSFLFLWDAAQVVSLPLVVVGALASLRHRLDQASALALVATGVAVDMSLAAPRVLSHTEYLRAGQVARPVPVDRSFSFSGNERLPSDDIGGSGSSLYNAFQKVPDQFRFGLGVQPQMQAYDERAGDLSPFSRFVRFPDRWTVPSSSLDDAATASAVADLPGQPWPIAGGGPVATPECVAGEAGVPAGLVTKLLPDRTSLRVETDCARLAVLMDTWAPGWTVTVDELPARAIRVNEVLRGVVVPAGNHTVTWSYRPVHWPLIVTLTLGSLATTIGLAVIGAVRPRTVVQT